MSDLKFLLLFADDVIDNNLADDTSSCYMYKGTNSDSTNSVYYEAFKKNVPENGERHTVDGTIYNY
jgi:hypothetical protein